MTAGDKRFKKYDDILWYVEQPQSERRWLRIGRYGAFVIPPRFVEAFPFSEGLAAVAPSKIVSPSFGYVDRTGKLAIAVQFDTAGSFSEGLAAVVVGDPPKVGYIDGRGKISLALVSDEAPEGKAPAEAAASGTGS